MFQESSKREIDVPAAFIDPITQEIMQDPVVTSAGQTYDREPIKKWFALGNQTDPLTNVELSDLTLIPNHALRSQIQSYIDGLEPVQRVMLHNRRDKKISSLGEIWSAKMNLYGDKLEQKVNTVSCHIL